MVRGDFSRNGDATQRIVSFGRCRWLSLLFSHYDVLDIETRCGMTDADPLPVSIHKYVADGNHDATPNEVLDECGLNESRRAQVEHFLAITRYSMFKNVESNDADGLWPKTVEWADVADWEV
jgi:hypothetical protein